MKDREGEIELDIENEYIMSPKDLCTVGFVNKLADAGVRVLKIEGRARSAEYVRTVCECYDEANTGLPGGELFGGADRGVEKAVGDGIQPGLLERVLSGTAAGGMERGVRFESHEEKGVVGQGDQLFHETGCRGVQAGVV